MRTCGTQLGRLSGEMGKAQLGDPRRAKRLGKIVDALLARPGESFPNALGTDAALEAGYRFFKNRRVTPELILQPHIDATVARSGEVSRVVVLHDTSQFRFEDG